MPVINLPDDPLPQHPFYLITQDNVRNVLFGISNKSGPGPSGIGYKLVKWVFEAHPDFILDIFNAALRLGHHPWTTTKVMILPKLNKEDYSAAKSYQPVSLLEYFGKTLEKVVANCFTSDSNLHNNLPLAQFGSRPYHLATDACNLLWYKAEMTTQSGRIGGVLLFDISRFFDCLDLTFTSQVFRHLGIDDEMVLWVNDFMSCRTITMAFNNHTMDPLTPDLGTPQGSPLSPILSVLVTGPILCLVESWEDLDLTLYVDNRSIFALGPTYKVTADKLTTAANCIFSWLRDSGFTINADKCKTMFFQPWSRTKTLYGMPPLTIKVSLGNGTETTITPAISLCYLGVFFTPQLNWMTHVQIMSTHVLSLVKGLGVLGNSIRGFRLVNWRKIFISVILPILTYGCQVWFKDVS